MFPRKIKIEMGNLFIDWDNEEKSCIKLADLRYNCPCAVCLEDKNKKGNGYIPLYNEKEMTVASVERIGNYAVGITWKDGHNSGIYNFEYLNKLMIQ